MSSRASYSLCALALAALLSAWASPASACSYGQQVWALPTMESRVPTNTRIWFYVDFIPDFEELTRDAFVLETADGAVVPTKFDRILSSENSFGRALFVLTPLEPLLVGSEYRASADKLYYEARFVVTDEPDTEAPRKPKEVSRDEYAEAPGKSNCGEFAIVARGYELTNPMEELLVVALDDHHSFDPADLSGTFFDAASSAEPESEGVASVGYGTTPVSGWPDSNPKTVRSRVGTFDLAGNFSGWSEPTIIDLPPIPDSCAVTAPGIGGSGRWLLAIGGMLCLIFARRMQRAGRASTRRASASCRSPR